MRFSIDELVKEVENSITEFKSTMRNVEKSRTRDFGSSKGARMVARTSGHSLDYSLMSIVIDICMFVFVKKVSKLMWSNKQSTKVKEE
ncbi:hypothetical protein YC2023_027658 [Brassica napus]